ncbi:MAG: helix-turn-helix domain-containing protein [Anaerolineales bacterium]|nr:helix-turn-helix domain-containing protein [Anaerolineales bacterium]
MSTSIPVSTLEKFTTFGDLLRFLRRRAGITQMELSIAVGYSDAQISRLEQNLRLPDITTIEARFISALGLEEEPRAVSRLLELAANIRREDAPGLGLCPYKGLSYFEETDADLFVGREALTEKLTASVLSLTLSGSLNKGRFLAVVGASGSGKSSLVRAGLLPALRWNKTSADWNIHVFTPATHPLESLAASLTRENNSVMPTTTLMDDMGLDPRSLQIFAKRKLGLETNARLLLVIDQFEELFALCRSEDERTAFVGNLLTAAFEVNGPVIVVITLRADFYAHCANYPPLREALAQNQEYIGAMSGEELQRAVEEPARRGRWEFEPGLVDLLLHEVGHEPGALPLLSHALMETWQRRRGRMMTLSGYTSSGGVRGAIAETAEAVFADQFTHEQREIARRIFLRLTELGDETSSGDTRRRASFNELVLKPEDENTTRSVLKILADSRLITAGEDTVEVAHEALIREWPTLRGWLEDNREDLRLHRHLTETAHEWFVLNRESDLLYRGARLTLSHEWAIAHEHEINVLEREFLAASIEYRERETAEREAQRQRELETAQKLAESEKQRAEEQTHFAGQLSRRARYLTGAFAIALVMGFIALFFGSQARQIAVTAQNERRIATARELASASLNNLSVDPERSILLALQAISTTGSIDGTVLPEAEEALHRSIVASPIRLTLRGHETKVLSAAFSLDGKRLATIGGDGTVIVWDSTTGAELLRLPGTTKPSDLVTEQRIAYSPDGRQLAACDSDQLKVYDPVTGELLMALSGHQGDVLSVTFSLDGKYLATGSGDTTVRIWNASTGDLLHVLKGHTAEVGGLAFSPDGEFLITSSEDAMLKIWDVATGDLLRDLPEFTVYKVSFNVDGTQLAAATANGIQVWNIAPESDDVVTFDENHAALTIPEGGPMIFSPNGTQLAAVSLSTASGNAIKLWDATSGRELLTLAGHTGWVMGIALSPDGQQLASTSLDRTIKIWSLTPGQETIAVVSAVTGYGTRVAYNPNGQEFATNGGDGTATLWNAKTGEPRLIFRGHDIEVLNVAFSPDGTRFATGSLDGTVVIWDTASGQKLLTLIGHEVGVRDIAFSPNGSLIATGGFDGTAKVWDAKTGTVIYEITGHDGIVLGVAFSPDGTRLATSSTDATAKIWDVKTGELLLTLSGHNAGLPDIAYSPDGSMIASGSGDGTAILWDAATGAKLQTLIGHSSQIQSVAFSPDGKLLATGSEDNTAKVWDVASGEEILTLPGNLGGVRGVAFSPVTDSTRLVVASSDGVTRIFVLPINELLALAQSRVTRLMTTEECQKYLHVEQCPVTKP